MYKAVIASYSRSAFTMAKKGALINVKPDVLLSEVIKKHPILFVVDGISSVASVPCDTEKLGIDVLISATQKGWVTPPGLAFISVSKKAWEYHKTSNCPKYYFDISQYKNYFLLNFYA